jgi:hypothetical protein
MVTKKWEEDVVGILAPQDYVAERTGRQAVFINNQNSLQFYIKIISVTPSSFPHDVTLVTAYTSDLIDAGFEDPMTDRDSRIEALTEFLSDRLVVFQPHRKTIVSGQDVYGVTDLRVQMRVAGFSDNTTFTPIPMYTEEKHGTLVEFEDKLRNNRFVGRIEHIPHDPDDTPPFVVWKNKNGECLVYGIVESHRWAFGGFAFQCPKLKKIDFNEIWFEEAFDEGDILFVSNKIINEIETALAGAKTEELQFDTPVPNPAPDETKGEDVSQKSELDFLDAFSVSAKERGLLFDDRDLVNFHTAMKSSNLVILAGMSGTGKSRLVEVYARALGLGPKQLNIIPVRPSWSDDADLVGYVDTKNHIYRPGDTGLIETLRNADENPNQLYIICFDEMNLARVEHYFSQFLSVLESPPPRRLRLYNEQLANRLYNSAEYPPFINIGENVMFVGTVNLDESTYHFSDKVLDRANVITLRVLPFRQLRDLKLQSSRRDPWNAEDFQAFKNRVDQVQLSDREIEFFERVHDVLHRNNKQQGVGFRIVRQVDMYLKNLPSQSILTRQEAFDLQVVQRILTKLRGSEDQLRTVIGTYDLESQSVKDSGLLSILDEFADVSKFHETRDVLFHKAKELRLHGYTV